MSDLAGKQVLCTRNPFCGNAGTCPSLSSSFHFSILFAAVVLIKLRLLRSFNLSLTSVWIALEKNLELKPDHSSLN